MDIAYKITYTISYVISASVWSLGINARPNRPSTKEKTEKRLDELLFFFSKYIFKITRRISLKVCMATENSYLKMGYLNYPGTYERDNYAFVTIFVPLSLWF